MPATIWGGSINFGLVSMPVKLTPATQSRDVSFNQLEADTGARIRYRRVSEATGEVVPTEQIVKGFEVAKGRYVTIDKAELAALAPSATHTIEIEDFVGLDEIDPVYFQTPYYVLPDKSATKPYRLLLEAMVELRKVAIGRVVMRGKEHLVAIRPLDGLLCVETMRYADEVIPVSELGGAPGADLEIDDREMAMARQLIESLGDDFDAGKYRDEYREQVLDLIDRKAAGEEIVAEPQLKSPAKVLDLMAALEASLERTGSARPKSESSDLEPGRDETTARPSTRKKTATKKKRSA